MPELTQLQSAILASIKASPGMTGSAIGERLGRDRNQMRKAALRLAALGHCRADRTNAGDLFYPLNHAENCLETSRPRRVGSVKQAPPLRDPLVRGSLRPSAENIQPTNSCYPARPPEILDGTFRDVTDSRLAPAKLPALRPSGSVVVHRIEQDPGKSAGGRAVAPYRTSGPASNAALILRQIDAMTFFDPSGTETDAMFQRQAADAEYARRQQEQTMLARRRAVEAAARPKEPDLWELAARGFVAALKAHASLAEMARDREEPREVQETKASPETMRTFWAHKKTEPPPPQKKSVWR
jgi:hypothetical protein